MSAFESIGFSVTGPGTAGAEINSVPGDSFVVREAKKDAKLVNILIQGTSGDGIVRMTSPLLHDSTSGITLAFDSDIETYAELYYQEVKSQDRLRMFGTANTGDIHGFYSLYYPDSPGIDARLETVRVLSKIEHISSQKIVSGTGKAGEWSGGVALTSATDEWKANRDYVILGFTIEDHPTGNVTAIGVKGPETGNLRIGCPIFEDRNRPDQFINMAERSGLPLLPVFNGSNAELITIDLMPTLAGFDNKTMTIVTGLLKRGR